MKNKPTYLNASHFFSLLLSLSADIFAQKGHTKISVKPALLYFPADGFGRQWLYGQWTHITPFR